MATMVSQVFDQVLLLKEGEKLVLQFDTPEDRESKRIMLYREKRKYEAAHKGANFKTFFIACRGNAKKGEYLLELSTNGSSLDWLATAVIKKQGEEVRKLDLNKPAENTEKERLEMLKQKEK